jgi:hypothetical protein
MDGPLLTSKTYFLTKGVANILASKDLVAITKSQNDKINLKERSLYYNSQVVSEFFILISLYTYNDLELKRFK